MVRESVGPRLTRRIRRGKPGCGRACPSPWQIAPMIVQSRRSKGSKASRDRSRQSVSPNIVASSSLAEQRGKHALGLRPDRRQKVEAVVFKVPKMYADHHVLAVRAALTDLDGVTKVVASSAFKRVAVTDDVDFSPFWYYSICWPRTSRVREGRRCPRSPSAARGA